MYCICHIFVCAKWPSLACFLVKMWQDESAQNRSDFSETSVYIFSQKAVRRCNSLIPVCSSRSRSTPCSMWVEITYWGTAWVWICAWPCLSVNTELGNLCCLVQGDKKMENKIVFDCSPFRLPWGCVGFFFFFFLALCIVVLYQSVLEHLALLGEYAWHEHQG